MVNSYTARITQYLFKKAKPPKCNPLLPLVIMHKSSDNTPSTSTQTENCDKWTYRPLFMLLTLLENQSSVIRLYQTLLINKYRNILEKGVTKGRCIAK